jgi:type VI secretion system protein ImpF
MARPPSDARPQLSVFDRLLDDNPKNQQPEVPPTRHQAVRLYKDAVGRDLESLLNTRANPWEAGPEHPELRDSMYGYGLPDFSGLTVRAASHRQRLVKRIQQAILEHEPRLGNVVVDIPADNDGPHKLQLRFVVTAMLKMDPAPEQVSFDTVLEISRGEYQVKGT